jgi:fermentation-respiration switch protein FrsA (DUF1100 family)
MPLPTDDAANGNQPVAESARRPTRAGRLAWLWRIGKTLLLLYVFVVVAAMFLENSLLFLPSVYPSGNWRPGGLNFEDAWFSSADGTSLHGWYVPCRHAKAAVLFCHGNGGNLSGRADVLKALHDQVGVSTLIFDYRGYGRSQGRPNEAGVLADARAARRWLADREKIAEADIVVMGESLGGAVAVDLAARDGARALVLESTFNNLSDAAAHHYPWLPVRWLMRSRFDSAGKIGDYHGPVWQAHGDADRIVPLPLGQRLFAAANQPKQFKLLPGHDHNHPMLPGYYAELATFFARLPRHDPTQK